MFVCFLGEKWKLIILLMTDVVEVHEIRVRHVHQVSTVASRERGGSDTFLD